MLFSAKLMAFVAVTDAARAKAFYANVLGLKTVSEDSFAVVFDSGGTLIRAAIVKEVSLAPYTVLGWQVSDVASIVRSLSKIGVQFERYSFMEQDEFGIWTAPGGARVAWFKDPDGNLLSVSQH